MAEQKAMAHLQQGPAVVQLNVGGTLFQTSKDTLLKVGVSSRGSPFLGAGCKQCREGMLRVAGPCRPGHGCALAKERSPGGCRLRALALQAEAAGLRDLMVSADSGALRFDGAGHLFLDSNPRTFEVGRGGMACF